MAELVDAADLKSADYYNLKGSSPFIPKINKLLPQHIRKREIQEEVIL